jgi:hypothetical protein
LELLLLNSTRSGKKYTIDCSDEDDMKPLTKPEEVVDYVVKKIG